MSVRILTNLCRICLTNDSLQPIFENDSVWQLHKKIMACAAVHIAPGDSLPDQICRPCYQALEIAYLFKTKCEEIDRYLKKIIDEQLKLLKKNGQLTDKYTSVQISIEPSTVSIFSGLNSFSWNGNKQTKDNIRIETNLHEEVINEQKIRLPRQIDEVAYENEETIEEEEHFECLKTEVGVSFADRLDSKEACKKLINNHSIDTSQDSFQNDVYLPESIQSNEEMYLHHDDIELGEECEIESEPSNYIHSSSSPIGASKGKYIVIKSKPQNNVNINKTEVSVKTEIPEPAVYIETETVENEEYCYEEYIEEHLESEDHLEDEESEIEDTVATEVVETVMDRSEINTTSNIGETSSIIKDDKYKRRGRPKKSDKYKTPQGVSYLKSGRKNLQVFSKQRKSGRPKYIYSKEASLIKMKTDNGFENVHTKSLPIIKRARVEKITSIKHFDEKKSEPNRQLSTNLLLSDKFINKLNDPQKQVLYQRLKLQNQRPTSKKDITERGIPDKLETQSNPEEKHQNKKRYRKNTISDDLAIINNHRSLQTIDQDLKLINGDSINKKDDNISVTKTGRHTAIKSKRPKKRENLLESQKIELDLVTRKSERQRSPKKIFPAIDLYAKKEEMSDVESIKETEKGKFKLKIRDRYASTCSEGSNYSTSSSRAVLENNSDFDLKEFDDESIDKESEDKLLDAERVKLDYGAGLSCNVCNKSFPYRSHLIRHVRTHTGLKPYNCEYCKKNFTSLSSLNMHVKNHVGDHPYACEVCGRGFAQPSVLKRHMLSHTGEHPYQCQICFNTFVHDSSLKTHLKMHAIQEPQHKCDICDKKFRYLSTLTSHQKTHSGIKPFTCPECRKAFYRRSLLTRHMRSHTKERPYKCKLCKAKFAYSGGLASHKKLHTGVRPHQCTVCEFTFFRSAHLKNHMLKIHNNGVVLKCDKCNFNFDSNPLFKKHLDLHLKLEAGETTDDKIN